MANLQTPKKRRLVKASDKTPKPEQEPQSGSGSDSDSDSDPTFSFSQLLEPYSKDQLVSLIASAAASSSSLRKLLLSAADADVSHRKIFVHGLGYDTTSELLLSAFQPFGAVEDSNLVVDKLTGKIKGYAFVVFKTRRAALKALKEPKKTIGDRVASCQLASVGPGTPNSNPNAPADSLSSSTYAARKIYVSGVPLDVDAERLKAMFAKFGEIETGPTGFDKQTGKCRGFALFVYRTVEGARKALEEPAKMFEGHRLNCQKAAEGSKNNNNAGPTQTPPLTAVPGLQNVPFFGQFPGMNPMYSGLITNLGGGLVPGIGSNPAMMGRPLLAEALNSSAFPAGQYGQIGVGGLGGVTQSMGSFGAGGSLLGAYGTMVQLPPAMQSLQQQVYPASQTGQTATIRPQGNGTGYTQVTQRYMWYDKFCASVSLYCLCLFGCRLSVFFMKVFLCFAIYGFDLSIVVTYCLVRILLFPVFRALVKVFSIQVV